MQVRPVFHLLSEAIQIMTNTSFEYVFPAIKGMQARREYYISMCPMRLIPKLFVFNDEELPPELRAQRTLNKTRLPQMARYILDNRNDYTFSAITASVDADVKFMVTDANADSKQIGRLHIPMTARFIINDGQHRRAAIEIALRENPELADESIAVVFFLDRGLERCQQMFADLNRHAIRPSRSIGVLYDHRDRMAEIAKLIVLKSPLFCDVVEMEKSNLSLRSRKLFTLSAIYSATTSLLGSLSDSLNGRCADVAILFWEEVAKHFPEWHQVREGKLTASEVRADYIHSHGIALKAIGRVGNVLLRERSKAWKRSLKQLSGINWLRSNAKLWEGRAMIGGRISKAESNVILTTNVLKKELGLSLTPEEQRLENALTRGDHAN
jgi:DNA sulfur modification protein DndB